MEESAEMGRVTPDLGLSSPNFIQAFKDKVSEVALANNHNPEIAMAMAAMNISIAGKSLNNVPNA